MKYTLIGILVVAIGSAAMSQTDTTTAPPANPDTKAAPAEREASSVVKRAVICTGVSNHEPADSLALVPSTVGKVFFFTELAGMEGKTITHRWTKDGSKVADVRVSVASNRYRCHSSRSVSGKAGNWTVQILDEDGNKLAERRFTVEALSVDSPVGKT